MAIFVIVTMSARFYGTTGGRGGRSKYYMIGGEGGSDKSQKDYIICEQPISPILPIEKIPERFVS